MEDDYLKKEGLKMDSLFDLKSLGQPVVHGNKIFYIETTPNKEENSYHSLIYSFDQTTKERRRWGMLARVKRLCKYRQTENTYPF